MSKKLALIGGGGHCRSIIACLNLEFYDSIIIVDHPEKIGKTIDGIKIEATDDELPYLFSKGYTYAFIAIGSIKADSYRKKLAEKIKSIGFVFPSVIDKTAVIAKNTQICEGVFIGKNAVVNTGTIVKSHAIINTGTIVDHDCIIGDFVHLAPGVVLSGSVQIGENSHIGTGTCIRQGVRIGEFTTIGMGSVVLDDIPSYCTAFGVPCKKVKTDE